MNGNIRLSNIVHFFFKGISLSILVCSNFSSSEKSGENEKLKNVSAIKRVTLINSIRSNHIRLSPAPNLLIWEVCKNTKQKLGGGGDSHKLQRHSSKFVDKNAITVGSQKLVAVFFLEFVASFEVVVLH